MSDSQLVQPRLELRVDAVVVQSLRCRHHLDEREGFDVLLDDPQVGCFALTDAFRLELRDGASDWRQVTLDELKKTLAKDDESAEADEAPQVPEAAERESFNRLVAEGEHIMRAEIALFNACIPFLQLPFQQDKFASNLLMVLNLAKAKACLQRAGFQPKFDSETVLFDACNGQAVQLIQGKYRLPRTKS